MFINIEQTIMQFLTTAAYDPITFYGFIIIIMTLATFGLPISEEMVLISAGLVTYMGAHPELYPPALSIIQSGQTPVQPATTALVCFLSVFLSDLSVYMLGLIFSDKIMNLRILKRKISQKRQDKINLLVAKYGHFVSGIFRFTPGLRLIGYLTCGIVRIPIHKFILINGGVALLIVPSQVLIIAAYGEKIISNLKIISVIIFIIFCIFILTIIIPQVYKYLNKNKVKKIEA